MVFVQQAFYFLMVRKLSAEMLDNKSHDDITALLKFNYKPNPYDKRRLIGLGLVLLRHINADLLYE